MTKYFLKGFYFSIPILAVLLFIVIIDPYEFIGISKVINSKLKIEVLNRSYESAPRGNMLWKTIHYKRKPKSKIIIGDSQASGIKESIIREGCGEDYFNFCIRGASYETMTDIFWFATEQTKLEKVFFQVGFMNYNASRSYNLFHFGKDYLEKPYIYFSTPDIFVDSYMNLLYRITGDRKLVEHPYLSMDVDSLDNLSENRLKLFFNNYRYPENYYLALKKISEYCKANDIELVFLILPIYTKTHEYLEKQGLRLMNLRFKEDIHRLGTVFDYEVLNKQSTNRNNFFDYFHPKQHIIDEITREVWGNN